VQIPVFLGLYHVLRHLSNSVALCNGRATSSLLTLYTFSGGRPGRRARGQGNCSARRWRRRSATGRTRSRFGGDLARLGG